MEPAPRQARISKTSLLVLNSRGHRGTYPKGLKKRNAILVVPYYSYSIVSPKTPIPIMKAPIVDNQVESFEQQ